MPTPRHRRRDERVRCKTHGHMPGYVICEHVIRGTDKQRNIKQPERTRDGWTIGEILCERDDHEVSDYRLICQPCATKAGFNEPKPIIVQ